MFLKMKGSTETQSKRAKKKWTPIQSSSAVTTTNHNILNGLCVQIQKPVTFVGPGASKVEEVSVNCAKASAGTILIIWFALVDQRTFVVAFQVLLINRSHPWLRVALAVQEVASDPEGVCSGTAEGLGLHCSFLCTTF